MVKPQRKTTNLAQATTIWLQHFSIECSGHAHKVQKQAGLRRAKDKKQVRRLSLKLVAEIGMEVECGSRAARGLERWRE